MLVWVILIAYKNISSYTLFSTYNILTKTSFIENEYPKFNEKGKRLIGKSFPEIAASNTKKLGLRMVAEKGHAGRAHGAELTGREMMYKPRLRTYGMICIRNIYGFGGIC